MCSEDSKARVHTWISAKKKKKTQLQNGSKDAKEQKTKQNTGWNYYLNYLNYYSINRK